MRESKIFMNSINKKMSIGAIGELLVQIRLLQYGVQAAPPLKDSGNDLIAVNGQQFRAISVRTTTTGRYTKPDTSRVYHVLAVVYLIGEGHELNLDETGIFLIPKDRVNDASTNCGQLGEYKLSDQQVLQLFGNPGD
jgi:hypothetical protein